MLRIAIVGSRSFRNYDFLAEKMDAVRFMLGDFQVVSGGAQGADLLGARWANERDLPIPIIINAEWDDLSNPDAIIKTRENGTKYDALAGIRRNAIIIDQVDAVCAFWDGKSNGTKNTIQRAVTKHLPVLIWHPERTPKYINADNLERLAE